MSSKPISELKNRASVAMSSRVDHPPRREAREVYTPAWRSVRGRRRLKRLKVEASTAGGTPAAAPPALQPALPPPNLPLPDMDSNDVPGRTAPAHDHARSGRVLSNDLYRGPPALRYSTLDATGARGGSCPVPLSTEVGWGAFIIFVVLDELSRFPGNCRRLHRFRLPFPRSTPRVRPLSRRAPAAGVVGEHERREGALRTG